MKNRLINLSRGRKQLLMMVMDGISILFCLWFAFVLRLGDFFPEYIYPSWWLFIVLPVITIPLFIRLGMYRSVLRYIGVRIVTITFQATTISCLVVGFFMMFFREETIQGTESLPRSVLIIFWFISNVIIISSRFILKGLLYSWENLVTDRRKTIIYGAGSAGVQILDSLKL